jgi:chlorite dismutase
MTGEQKQLLAVFEVRVRDLIGVCDQQKQRINELIRSLESKNEELRQAMQTIETLKAKCDNMLTARIVSTQEKEVKSAKKRLSKLVREVDMCIALLNE